jgi:hypothetical protein
MMANEGLFESRIAFVTGEVHALLMFCQILARTHPNPETVVAGLEVVEQKGVAQIGGSLVSDSTVEGFRFVIDELRKLAEAAAARQQS